MPSKQYINPETSTTWADTGGDKLMDLGGLASATGLSVGAYKDLGAAPRCSVYEFEMFIDAFDTGAPTVGTTIDLFVIQSNDSTNFDGPPTTAPTSSAEGAMTDGVATLRNATYVGSLTVYVATQTRTLRGRFVTHLTSRYIAPVVVNRTNRALKSSGDAHRVIMTPVPYESQ